MAVNWPTDAPWRPVAGVRLATMAAGIRYKQRDDLLLITVPEGASAAAMFTRNAFCAAPVHVARRHLQHGAIRALVINAGNANAGTGAGGLQAAEESCQIVANALGCSPAQVLPFSTGVIGQPLPVAPFVRALPELATALSEDAWPQAARAIMTTDTLPKLRSRHITLTDGTAVTLTGICKGAGMIKPDMATMLAFLATDARVAPAHLDAALRGAVEGSFNAITVDGDTSTNDACVLLASGAAGATELHPASADWALFTAALTSLCQELAQGIIRDAEGATRFISVVVSGAASRDEARAVAYAVAESPLVKTAAFAGDPNWGRILAAVGRSGVADLDINRVSLWLDDVALIANGQPHPDYREEKGAAVAAQAEFSMRVDLGRGHHELTVWTCDYSYDYVKINAEYRS